MSQSDEKVSGHSYDGIEEYDNPLPTWWLITFFLTIQFSFLYWIHYEFGRAPTQVEELRLDLARLKEQRHQHPAPTDKEEELAALLKDPSALTNGKAVFTAKCSACHGAELQGSVGPNLVDEFWIHGNKLSEIALIVRTGVLDKGMPAWQEMLSNDEIRNVVAFIASSQGNHPANPKPPQGKKVGQN